MKIGSGTILATLAAAAVGVVGLSKTEGSAGATPVDSEVTAVIKAMCDHLEGLSAFRLQMESSVEEVLDDGQKLLFSQRGTATMRRPRELHVHTEGDIRNRTYWLDGRTLCIADHEHAVHAKVDVPDTIDKATEFLVDRYDMDLPLADLFSADPFTLFTERVRSGFRVGMHAVDGHPCHHLAFRQDDVDWQIWIDAGDVPVPRRLVITYKNEPGYPQYSVTLRDIRRLDTVDPATFRFAAPEGYERIDVIGREAGEKGR